MKQFLITIAANNVRDTQISIHEDADHLDEDAWKDFDDHDVVVGIFDAASKEEALTKAAEYIEASEDILVGYQIK